ncbi:Hypothetical predicted protein [Mytilus galloprovincialis]|uniref:Uncharacterized protein n=1 Tax=Mytilus galloprovincialis TaxID=29158 RepID=A0A8B6EEH5_MYTGA|nr:Hypothetical predicted protein [Mytilus galloprovincialis]
MDEITFKYLSAKRDLKPGRLYLLPKLHKLDPELIESVQQNPTLYKNVRIQGRPIVSLSGTVLERIGQYLDKFMLPAVLKQETHLRDSLEFINIIEKLQEKCFALRDVTNDPVDLQIQYALFSERLIKRGYPKNEIKPVMQEVTAKQRIDTLMVKPKSVLQSPPLVFSTVFSRQKSHIKNNILKHWDKLKDDEEAKLLFDKRPLFAFRRHKNLKDIVTSATLNN